jgi:hypothetical protein
VWSSAPALTRLAAARRASSGRFHWTDHLSAHQPIETLFTRVRWSGVIPTEHGSECRARRVMTTRRVARHWSRKGGWRWGIEQRPALIPAFAALSITARAGPQCVAEQDREHPEVETAQGCRDTALDSGTVEAQARGRPLDSDEPVELPVPRDTERA